MPVSFKFNRDSLVSVFANDEIHVDSGYVFTINGNAYSLLADTNKVVCSGGSIVTDSSSISSQLNRINDLFEFCEDEGGFVLGESDTLLSLAPGFFRINDTDSLPAIIELKNSNEQYIIYKEKNLVWSELHQLYYPSGYSNSELYLIAEDTIFVNGTLPPNAELFAKTIVIENTENIQARLFARNKILVKSNVVLLVSEIVQSCPNTTNDPCNLIINGDFSFIRNNYPLVGNSILDFGYLTNNFGAADIANKPFLNNVVCNWKETLPNSGTFNQIYPLVVNASTNSGALFNISTGIQSAQAFQPSVSSNSWVKLSFKYKKPNTYNLFLSFQPTNPVVVDNLSRNHDRIFPIFSEVPFSFTNNNYLANNGIFYRYMPAQNLINVGDAVVVDDPRLIETSNAEYAYFETYVQVPTSNSFKYLSIVNSVATISPEHNAAIVIDDIKVETCCISPITVSATNESDNKIYCSQIINYAETHPWNPYIINAFTDNSGELIIEIPTGFASSVIFERDIIVDIDVTIRNSTIILKDGIQITVNAGKRLKIDNSTLEGCQVKWQGILVQNYGELEVINSSYLKDAKYAVISLGNANVTASGSVQFANSSILNCNYGIVIRGSANSFGTYPFTFQTSSVTTSGGHLHNSRTDYDANILNPGSVLPPTKGRSGIEVYYSGANVSIGSGTTVQVSNNISNLEQGLRIISANTNITNTYFLNIYSGSSVVSNSTQNLNSLLVSAAVFIEGLSFLPSRTVSLYSSNNQLTGGNRITNCANGIVGVGPNYNRVNIDYTSITNVIEAIHLDKFAKTRFSIKNNRIEFARRFGIQLNNNVKSEIYIQNNFVSNTNGSANVNSSFGYGIWITGPTTNSNTNAVVTDNEIVNYPVGLLAFNLNSTNEIQQFFPPESATIGMTNYFANNQVTLKPQGTEPFSYGYYFNNCKGKSYFYENQQFSFGTSVQTNAQGFIFVGSTDATIMCNSSEYVKFSNLFSLGDQPLTFAGNLMQHGNYGVYLNGSSIGIQGVDNQTFQKVSHLNSWFPFNNPTSGGFSSHLFADNVNGNNSRFYLKCITCSTGVGEATSPIPFYSGSSGFLGQFIPFEDVAPIYSLFRNDNSTCWEHGLSEGPLSISAGSSDPQDSPFMKRYQALQIADTFNLYDSQRVYDATYELYADLMQDEGYLENDTLESFVDSLELENIGKFYQIETELSDKLSADTLFDIRSELSKLENRISTIADIQSTCDSITPTGNFEQTQLAILNLLLAEEIANLANLDSMYTLLNASSNIDSLLLTINVDSLSRFTWSNAEQDSIQVLAERCAFTYGKCVFNARALWSSFDTLATPLIACEIPNPVSARFAGKKNEDVIEEISLIKIFPNPVKSSLNIYISTNQEETLTEIIDIYGRVVLTKQLGNAELHMLDISSISTGWYLVRITRPLSGSFVQSVFIER
jgi:hypothetical protein